jgi:hypothetical protein
VEELTEEDAWAIFEEEARRVLGITGGQFREHWTLGKFAHADDPRVTRVAMLLPSAWQDAPGNL